MNLDVKENQAGNRLDKFLTNELGQARNQIQKMIKAGLVSVDGRVASANYNLKAGDQVVLKKPTAKKADAKKTPINFEIIAQTKDYLVINKPVGLLMHGSPDLNETNLADLLAKKYPALSKVGDDPYRPGIVHRIDKDVSGLILVAKTQKFFDAAKQQFIDRSIKKSYTALAHGKISADQGLIDFPIERAAAGHKMAARPKGADGRRAISEFTVLKKFNHFTLVKVAIKTGRTHQIRAHFSAYGHPLVGDNLYGNKSAKDKNKKLATARVYLAADELSFVDLDGERQNFKLELPEDFKEIFKKIK
jgi:23S rRNA pseudouridine1911/1915/1917 synthase